MNEATRVTFIDVYYKGFHVGITKRGDEIAGKEDFVLQAMQVKEAVDAIENMGFEPSWNTQTNKEVKQNGFDEADRVMMTTAPKKSCKTCGADVVERQGTSKAGKRYHGLFCKDNDAHIEWLPV